jgi:hypothetical protein
VRTGIEGDGVGAQLLRALAEVWTNGPATAS